MEQRFSEIVCTGWSPNLDTASINSIVPSGGALRMLNGGDSLLRRNAYSSDDFLTSKDAVIIRNVAG